MMRPASNERRLLPWRLATGEQQAFAELFDSFAPAMLRTGATLLGNADDAQDAVQEVFLAMARGRKSLTGVQNLRAYLLTALRRECIRLANRRRRRTAAMSAAPEQARAPQGGGWDNGERDGDGSLCFAVW